MNYCKNHEAKKITVKNLLNKIKTVLLKKKNNEE